MTVLDSPAVLGPLQAWILPALLGIGLASATGLRTFLPLLMLGLAAKFGWFGVRLLDEMEWLASWPALGALAVAALVEFAGDKIPVVDHGLNTLGYLTRPAAGALAAASVFWAVDPTAAAVAGLVLGAPAALAFNVAQTGVRTASTLSTAGLGNPLVSFIEDGVVAVSVLAALAAPVLAPVALILLTALLLWLVWRARRPRPATAG